MIRENEQKEHLNYYNELVNRLMILSSDSEKLIRLEIAFNLKFVIERVDTLNLKSKIIKIVENYFNDSFIKVKFETFKAVLINFERISLLTYSNTLNNEHENNMLLCKFSQKLYTFFDSFDFDLYKNEVKDLIKLYLTLLKHSKTIIKVCFNNNFNTNNDNYVINSNQMFKNFFGLIKNFTKKMCLFNNSKEQSFNNNNNNNNANYNFSFLKYFFKYFDSLTLWFNKSKDDNSNSNNNHNNNHFLINEILFYFFQNIKYFDLNLKVVFINHISIILKNINETIINEKIFPFLNSHNESNINSKLFLNVKSKINSNNNNNHLFDDLDLCYLFILKLKELNFLSLNSNFKELINNKMSLYLSKETNLERQYLILKSLLDNYNIDERNDCSVITNNNYSDYIFDTANFHEFNVSIYNIIISILNNIVNNGKENQHEETEINDINFCLKKHTVNLDINIINTALKVLCIILKFSEKKEEIISSLDSILLNNNSSFYIKRYYLSFLDFCFKIFSFSFLKEYKLFEKYLLFFDYNSLLANLSLKMLKPLVPIIFASDDQNLKFKVLNNLETVKIKYFNDLELIKVSF